MAADPRGRFITVTKSGIPEKCVLASRLAYLCIFDSPLDGPTNGPGLKFRRQESEVHNYAHNTDRSILATCLAPSNGGANKGVERKGTCEDSYGRVLISGAISHPKEFSSLWLTAKVR
jgi:hypothetical protein